MNSSRDALGSFLPFSAPAIVDGRVFIGADNTLVVFGLLTQSSPASEPWRRRYPPANSSFR